MNETLTENQQRFFAMLGEFPRLSVYWDPDRATLNQVQLAEDLPTFSSGERALARFFASLWLGNNSFDFDLFRDLKDCDACAQSMIAAWVANPFFP